MRSRWAAPRDRMGTTGTCGLTGDRELMGSNLRVFPEIVTRRCRKALKPYLVPSIARPYASCTSCYKLNKAYSSHVQLLDRCRTVHACDQGHCRGRRGGVRALDGAGCA